MRHVSRYWSVALAAMLMVSVAASISLRADESDPLKSPASTHDFHHTIKPLLVNYCHACHNAKDNKGELNLVAFPTEAELTSDPRRLESILEAVGQGFMPPQEAKQLSDEQRALMVEWGNALLQRVARAHAGDPGRVVLRRLTNAELRYTLTDLTGIERNWTNEFPHDSSGGEGFSNTGQTLQMSASQIEKYLALAEQLVDHALMLPGSGPVFLETPVSTFPEVERARWALDRLDHYCRTNELVYTDVTPREQITSYAYPDAKAKSRDNLSHMRGYKAFSSEVPGASLSFVGSTHRLFYRTEKLNPTPSSYMIHRGSVTRPVGADGQQGLADKVRKRWENLWFDLRHATGYARPAKISLLHRWFSHQPYQMGDNPSLEAEMKKWKVRDGNSPDGYKRYSLDPSVDLSFTVTSLAGYLRSMRSFSNEELKEYGNIQQSADGESRTLMVPNHDAFDAFLHRSLDEKQIEVLWRMVCDPSSKLAQRLADTPPEAMQREWRLWTQRQRSWEENLIPRSQAALCRFAALAWRRPLTASEKTTIQQQFQKGTDAGQSIQEAMRLPLFRILVSPHFLYRMEFGAPTNDPPRADVRSLNPYELASRLSFFLWSSVPDETLTHAAETGALSNAADLAHQARRMMRDPRIRRFSREMFGQWLGFYRFDDWDRPSRERFPRFDAELREAMTNEAIDFCTDLVAEDRDVRSLLHADYGFLSRRLARHYGVPMESNEEHWEEFEKSDTPRMTVAPRISLADTRRRGVLGWGAMLTATSHPLRTSPVLRGNWVLDDLLGIPTPPPPNAVPELPQDEKNDEGLTIAQLLGRHRQDEACAVCHDRIDPFGLALEHFDAVGRYRDRDLNGTVIDAKSRLHDGTVVDGLAGLVAHLRQAPVQELFLQRLSRKVLGYALGREVIPGDTLLLDEIQAKLKSHNYRFSIIVESIVTSSQFRKLRVATDSVTISASGEPQSVVPGRTESALER